MKMPTYLVVKKLEYGNRTFFPGPDYNNPRYITLTSEAAEPLLKEGSIENIPDAQQHVLAGGQLRTDNQTHSPPGSASPRDVAEGQARGAMEPDPQHSGHAEWADAAVGKLDPKDPEPQKVQPSPANQATTGGAPVGGSAPADGAGKPGPGVTAVEKKN